MRMQQTERVQCVINSESTNTTCMFYLHIETDYVVQARCYTRFAFRENGF